MKAVLTLILALSAPLLWAQTEKPNVILILVDDMGWNDTAVPFHFNAAGEAQAAKGNQTFKTPTLEKLAGLGVRFTNAYAASVCSPTRTAIMSGNNPSRTHISNWTHPSSPQDTNEFGRIKNMAPPAWRMEGLNKCKSTLGTMFKKAGYSTLYVGKGHLGPSSEKGANPQALGFDTCIAASGAGQPGSYQGYNNYSEGPRRQDDKLPLGPRDVPSMQKYHGSQMFLTDALTTELIALIEKNSSTKKPFFAFFAHYAVHAPFMMDAQFEGDYPGLEGGHKRYATLVSGVDKSLAALLAKLEELGVAENTLLIFASDNGGVCPTDRPSAPLRAKKGTAYEGGIRTPLIFAWAKPDPSNKWQKKYPIEGGSHNDKIVALQDLYATLGSMVGGPVPADIDSQDFSGYLTAAKSSPRKQSYFLNYPHEHNDSYFILYREGDWKCIYRYHTGEWELFNLKDDIAEQNNLAAAQPKKLKEMAAALVRENKRHKAQAPIDTATKKPATIQMPQ